MKRASPAEAEVRVALRNMLITSSRDEDPCLIDEFWIPQSNERVDVALVGPTLKAFEIKTERDTLKRLPRQANAYGRLFDECTAVVAERHLAEAITTLPEWWGLFIIVVGEDVEFESVRPTRRNPNLDSETLVRLLWRDEVFEALTDLGAIPPPAAGRAWMWESLLSILDTEGIRSTVTRALLQRDPARARIATRRFLAPLDSQVVA